MCSDDVAIRVRDLGKAYQIYDAPRDRLKQFVIPRLRRATGLAPAQYFREFWALQNISFEVRRGETVGIVGRNGCGKSTLLQLICGTLTPTTGTVETNGRVAALLELGSGFNAEFSGRENVYINAALLGLTHEEVDQRFDAIAAFADIGEFIDQPVKTYSSGMYVRLAFAVHSQVDPEIFIVDEALAVGDAKFQARCFNRLKRMQDNGTSVLLVTHATEQIVTHCSSAVLLDKGRIADIGEPKRVVNKYLDLLFGKDQAASERASEESIQEVKPPSPSKLLSVSEDLFSSHPGYNPLEYRWGDGAATIIDYCLTTDDGEYPSAIRSGQSVSLYLTIRFNKELVRPILGLTIKTKEGVTVYGANSETLSADALAGAGHRGSVISVMASFRCLLGPGDYFISLGIATGNGEEVIPHDRRYDAIHLQVAPLSSFFGLADMYLQLTTAEVLQ